MIGDQMFVWEDEICSQIAMKQFQVLPFPAGIRMLVLIQARVHDSFSCVTLKPLKMEL